MKASTLPSIRVLPELRQAAEAVLKPGETLSALIEEALKQSIALRQAQREFIARGLASATTARQSDSYIASDAVLDKLEQRLQHAKTAHKGAR
ncbi:prevent-host-death protein [Pseudomonas cavernicola]|uniref:Prevent-host-death protein n=1 Tax=Pseudomonas cavernicola TaxID=2320866 RepID=A0A418XHL6_9PSED|nr:YlcI/YnfO family protein [Pseudomonas cavernicola]RJG11946.1 prevent-host-death protein [Pseudomonas cavernicola]